LERPLKTIELDGITWELPYWDLLPPLSTPAFEELKEDILDKGTNVYPVIWTRHMVRGEMSPKIVVDGGHRLRAVAELHAEGHATVELSEQRISFENEEEEKQAALDLNLKRRHLSPEQRAEWVARLRQEGKSTRQIAEAVGVDPKTVRNDLRASGGDNSPPEKIKGVDGKTYPANRPAPSPAGEHQAPRLSISTPEERAKISGPALYDEAEIEATRKHSPHAPISTSAGEHKVAAFVCTDESMAAGAKILVTDENGELDPLATHLLNQPEEETEERFCVCGRPVSCIGRYEGAEKESPSCDTCCGHGNEDGYCSPVKDEPAEAPAPLPTPEPPPIVDPVEVKKGPAAIMASGRDDHNTPPELLSVIRAFGGDEIALDPCHNANSTVNARHILTKEQDGLNVNWGAYLAAQCAESLTERQLVFINPPYDQETLSRVNDRAQKLAGDWLEIISLVPVKSDQPWFQAALFGSASAVCFIAGRVRFWADGKQQSGAAFESVLFYYGERPAEFVDCFGEEIGVCLNLKLYREARGAA
jgi:transposase-like protein